MAERRGYRRLGMIGAGSVLVALALAYGAWRWSAPSVQVLTLQAQDMVHTVVATATVQTPHRASSGVQITGKVLAVNVLEGERFRQGQVLLTLEGSEAQAALDAAQLGVRQAGFKLRQWREVQAPTARANDQQAQANAAQARSQFERQHKLLQQGFIGQAAFDEAVRALQVAQAQAQSAQVQRLANGDQGLEQDVAMTALVLARANAQVAQAHLSYTRLVAPFDGLVVSRTVEPGDAVQPGKTLFLLAPQGETELVALIDERHLAWLQLGQPAVASAEAFAQQRFAASVSRIAPGVDAQRGSIQVKLHVPKPPDYLRQDMTVSVEIEVGRRAATLAVPLEAVHEAQSPLPWVWRVSTAGTLARVPVTLGLHSGHGVELLTGVQVGERVLAVAGSDLHAGQHVRPRAP